MFWVCVSMLVAGFPATWVVFWWGFMGVGGEAGTVGLGYSCCFCFITVLLLLVGCFLVGHRLCPGLLGGIFFFFFFMRRMAFLFRASGNAIFCGRQMYFFLGFASLAVAHVAADSDFDSVCCVMALLIFWGLLLVVFFLFFPAGVFVEALLTIFFCLIFFCLFFVVVMFCVELCQIFLFPSHFIAGHGFGICFVCVLLLLLGCI